MTRQRKGASTRVRFKLTDLGGIIKETADIYRDMKAGRREHTEGRSLVWVLGQLRAMLEAQALERIEARLAEIEASTGAIGHGYEVANRPAITTH